MKMLLVPVPADRLDAGELMVRAAERLKLSPHLVDISPVFDLRQKLLDPQYSMALASANLSIWAVALNSFTDALKKDRELG